MNRGNVYNLLHSINSECTLNFKRKMLIAKGTAQVKNILMFLLKMKGNELFT